MNINDVMERIKALLEQLERDVNDDSKLFLYGDASIEQVVNEVGSTLEIGMNELKEIKAELKQYKIITR
jgi:hypothetical protein